MSAYMVSLDHINAMITAGLQNQYRDGAMRWYRGDAHIGTLSDETAGKVGAMLLAENCRSVNYRYAESDIEQPYQYELCVGHSPIQILKLIDCYEYQACEHEGWADSEAHRFCNALRNRMIQRLPGYDDAEWGF